MKKGQAEFGISTFKALVLAIVVSLAMLPFSGFSAYASAGQVMVFHQQQADKTQSGHSATGEHRFVASQMGMSGASMPGHDAPQTFLGDSKDHCQMNDCKANCGAVSLTLEPDLSQIYQSRTVYDELEGKALLPGKYPVPYPPPNA